MSIHWAYEYTHSVHSSIPMIQSLLLVLSVCCCLALAQEDSTWSNVTYIVPVSFGGCGCATLPCGKGRRYTGGCCVCFAWPPIDINDCSIWARQWQDNMNWPYLDPELEGHVSLGRWDGGFALLNQAAILRIKRSPEYKQALVTCRQWTDRKSTRLNSSHSQISYAVFCLKKK